MPAELSNFSPKRSVDQSLKSVNQSLYDASGKLNSAVAQTKQQFQGGIKKATNAFAAASNDVNQKISNAATTANDFASNAVQKASHKIEQIAKPNFGLNAIAKQAPNADVIAARKELEEAKRQIEALRSQISQSKESSLAQTNSGLNQVGNAITNEFQKTASELQSQSNVLANSNEFKSGSGVTPNGQLSASPSNGFQPKTNQFNTQSVAANPLAQTQPPKSQNNSFGSTTRTPVFQGQLKTPQFNSTQSGLASSPPQNVLRSMQNSGTAGSFQPSSNAPNSSKTGAAEQPGTSGSIYEATPFQNYAPAKGSQTGSFNSQAGFASQGTGSQNGVANASLPDNSRVTTASAASDLPAALLGGSSYSPGSTKLR